MAGKPGAERVRWADQLRPVVVEANRAGTSFEEMAVEMDVPSATLNDFATAGAVPYTRTLAKIESWVKRREIPSVDRGQGQKRRRAYTRSRVISSRDDAYALLRHEYNQLFDEQASTAEFQLADEWRDAILRNLEKDENAAQNER